MKLIFDGLSTEDAKELLSCVTFTGATPNTAELAATDSQQLQAVIADLSYVDQVIAEQGSIVQQSKCHVMIARSVARLSAMQ